MNDYQISEIHDTVDAVLSELRPKFELFLRELDCSNLHDFVELDAARGQLATALDALNKCKRKLNEFL